MTQPRRRFAIGAAIALAVTAGCASTPPPSLAPGADPTPIPQPPVDLPLQASVERNGIRLTLELDRNPMPAGAPTVITTTIENLGPDPLAWSTDGCEVALWPHGTMPDRRWRLGLEWADPTAAEYKSWTLDRIRSSGGEVSIGFVPERLADQVDAGTFGCGDIAIGEQLAPGASSSDRLVWDGVADRVRSSPPSGPVLLTATFGRFWRGAVEPPEVTAEPIELDLPAWIEGGQPAPAVHPGEAIDAALREPRLLDLVSRRDLGNATEPLLRLDPDAGAWQVGLLDHGDAPRIHYVVVDATSGAITDWIERAWDFEVDGFP